MAINFPNPATQTPVNTFSPTSSPSATTNGVTYNYTNNKWVAQAGSGDGGTGSGVAVHYEGPTPPSTVTSNVTDQWYNTNDGRLYTLTENENGDKVWIDASPPGSGGGGVDGGAGAAGGADAWGNVAADGTLDGGFNCTTANTATGEVTVTLITPMPSANYAVTLGGGAATSSVRQSTKTVNSFEILTNNSSGVPSNIGVSFAVFATDGNAGGYWYEDSGALKPTNSANNVEIGGGDITLNADGSSTFAGSITGTDLFMTEPASAGAIHVRNESEAGNPMRFVVMGDGQVRVGGDVIANTPNMRLNANGQMQIGTTTLPNPHTFTANVDSSQGAMFVNNQNTNVATPAAQLAVGAGSSGGENVLLAFSVANGTAGSGQINANGVSTCAFGNFSDRRLKENITELPSQWDNIKALKPSQFEFINRSDAGTQIGFIAQEFQEVYPEAVSSQASDLADGKERLMITGWSKTEAYLVKALQECMTRIETLEAEVASLKGGN